MRPSNHSGDRPANQPTEDELRRVLEWAKAEALRLRASEIEADDVAQATLIKLYLAWSRPNLVKARDRTIAQWRGYVKRAAQNTYIDLVRQHQRRLNREAKSQDKHVRLPERPGVIRPTVVTTATAHQGRQELLALIGFLPVRQRMIVYHIVHEERSAREVGKLLGIEPQTVRKHLRNAKERLAEVLGAVDFAGD